MNLTIRYENLPEESYNQLREKLGRYKVYFFRNDPFITLTVTTDMKEMTEILNITSQFEHKDLVLRQ